MPPYATMKKGTVMVVLDLFCGTKSIANAFQQHGHKVYTVDWNADFNPTLCADIGTLTANDIINICGGVPDIIWASPDCTTFSVAAISKHRTKDENGILQPKSNYANILSRFVNNKKGVKK